MANALGIRIVGGNDELQARIEKNYRRIPNVYLSLTKPSI